MFCHFFGSEQETAASHYAVLCAGLRERGWRVTVHPSNRGYEDPSARHPLRETSEGVRVERVWRPPFPQTRAAARAVNAGFMFAAWAARAALRSEHPDAVIIGSEPVLSVGMAPVIQRFWPDARIAHWAFDLYPEAAAAAGMLSPSGAAYRLAQRVARAGYQSCDLVVDVGPCMRGLLSQYAHGAREATLVPWAAVEPPQLPEPVHAVRRELFGQAALGLLYSGTLGRAHTFDPFLRLARLMRNDPVAFSFAARGTREAELRRSVLSDDSNVSLVPWCESAALAPRLASADVHLVSLSEEWTGLALPSKFWSALAVGRPAVFAGPSDSSIAQWIREHRVGWQLTSDNALDVANELRSLAREPERLAELRERCFRTYHSLFGKQRTIDAWDRELRALLP